MKKILLLVIIAIGLQAGTLWSVVKNMSLKNIKPISSYTISVQGVDVRGYTFHPDKMPNTTCVMVFTEHFFQMHCKDTKN